jgi:ABC-type multidrug transport system fused ATPase/permease subunit
MIGLALAYMINLEESLRSLFWNYCNMETSMVSVERCYEYTEIIQEAENVKDTDRESWPETGSIEFQNYYVKYRPTTELILKDLSFTIKGCERIGIVGRTGSGKSTLCLSLLRILEAHSGRIVIDGQDIAELGLQKLRSAITIIPQDPTLFEGSLKFNLDPYEKVSEEELMQAVQKSHLDQILKHDGDILNFMVRILSLTN